MEHNDRLESLLVNPGSFNATSEIDDVVDSLLDDCWKAILDHLCLFDIILLRATSNKFYKLCKKIRPFKKNFVLDQDKCAVYFVENGYLSCLKYAQQVLHFDLAENLFAPAAGCGQLETLKFLVEEYYRQYHQRPKNQQHDILAAAIRGKCDLDTLKYLKEDLSFKQRHFYSINIVASKGNFECFKYFSERNFNLRDLVAPMTKECFDYAVNVGYTIDLPKVVAAGNVEILRYAIEKYNMNIPTRLSYIAATTSYECLKFLIYKVGSDFAEPFVEVHDIKCFKLLIDYGATFSSEIYRTAAKAGLTDVIKLALDLGIPRPKFGDVAANAAGSGNIECFKLVVENGFPVLPCQAPQFYSARAVDVWTNVLRSRNLELFKYAHQLNVPFASTTQQRSLCVQIASQHDKSLLKWAWDTWSLKENALAAKIFSTMYSVEFLEMLQDDGFDFVSKSMTCLPSTWIFENMVYLYKLGCKWDPTIFDDYDSFMSIKYAHEHGCPWNPEILKRAAMTGNIRTLRYALTHGCPYTTLNLKQMEMKQESADYIKHFTNEQNPKQRCNLQ